MYSFVHASADRVNGVWGIITAGNAWNDGSISTPPPYSCAMPITLLTFLPDRLYLASYSTPPTADTVFPYPEQSTRGSPSKRSQRAAEAAAQSKANRQAPCYFTVDDTLLYNAFHHDFGPLHIGHLYRFALQFHDLLGAKENQNRPIVFWSRHDARSEFYPGKY